MFVSILQQKVLTKIEIKKIKNIYLCIKPVLLKILHSTQYCCRVTLISVNDAVLVLLALLQFSNCDATRKEMIFSREKQNVLGVQYINRCILFICAWYEVKVLLRDNNFFSSSLKTVCKCKPPQSPPSYYISTQQNTTGLSWISVWHITFQNHHQNKRH